MLVNENQHFKKDGLGQVEQDDHKLLGLQQQNAIADKMENKHEQFLPVHPLYLPFSRGRQEYCKAGKCVNHAHDHYDVIGSSRDKTKIRQF